MNPNHLTRELRNLPGNVHSSVLPGGSIISAIMERRLMTWSDRGGASRIFGEIWSEYCWAIMGNGSADRRTIPGSASTDLVLRLDANPRIAAQAARNKLSNPDFLVISKDAGSELRVRAIDAKFAIDRLRRTQVSPESVQDLVELPGSLVRQEIEQQLDTGDDRIIRYTPGAFVGPNSLLNDYYYERLTRGEEPDIPASELHLLDVDAAAIFERTEEYPLMMLLESLDGLRPYASDTDVLFGMYYLRLACAARWFEDQITAPLLSIGDPDPASIEQVIESTRQRIEPGTNAFQVVQRWSRSAEHATRQQEQVRDAARFPVRMSELRTLLEKAGMGDDKKRLRMLRGALERSFMQHLVQEVGEIPAQPETPVEQIVARVKKTSRGLKPEMLRQADTVVERFAGEDQ